MLAEYELGRDPGQLEEQPPVRPAPTRSATKNRGRLDTVAEIVNACSGGANKSRVMLVANVNSVVATELLNKLIDSGLVACIKEEGSVTFRATPEGISFVNRYTDLISMLSPGTVAQTRLRDLTRVAAAWV